MERTRIGFEAAGEEGVEAGIMFGRVFKFFGVDPVLLKKCRDFFCADRTGLLPAIIPAEERVVEEEVEETQSQSVTEDPALERGLNEGFGDHFAGATVPVADFGDVRHGGV